MKKTFNYGRALRCSTFYQSDRYMEKYFCNGGRVDLSTAGPGGAARTGGTRSGRRRWGRSRSGP